MGRTLDGSYFPFLYNNPGHFAHLMTEALARLWAWAPAKAADPSLKLLCRYHPSKEQNPQRRLESTLLPAFGIAPEDIVFVDGPVTVTSTVGCTRCGTTRRPSTCTPRSSRPGAGSAPD